MNSIKDKAERLSFLSAFIVAFSDNKPPLEVVELTNL